MTRYRTIVADPPWPMPTTGRRTAAGNRDGEYVAASGRTVNADWWNRFTDRKVELPYDSMTLDEIRALPVSDIADDDAHLYVWTTNRFLEATYGVVRAWGFEFSTLLTWCKTPMGLGFGGAYALTTEFLMFARRGSLAPTRRWDSTWMNLSRPYENGHIAHSAKPDAVLDMVEQVSPPPYVELFARRARFGWDYWGNESLGTAHMPEAAA